MLNLLSNSNLIEKFFSDIKKDMHLCRSNIKVFNNRRIIKYHHEGISFFMLEFKHGETLKSSINIKNYELKSKQLLELILENSESKYYTGIFLPSNVNTLIQGKRINLIGQIIESGHKVFFCFNSRHAINSIEPILANNNYYPYNSICGFKISCGSYRYVIFIHMLGVSGDLGNKTVNADLSVFEFLNDNLQSVSYVKDSFIKNFGI